MTLYILMAVIAFGLLVIIHEFGHFIMAKANGVMVESFSVGMGPKLFGIKGKETEYALRLFPIGGFVKMLGDEGKSNDERAFNNKTPGRKLSIVAAGPIMNFLLAIILFGIVTSFRGYIVPVIDEVVSNKPAAVAGLHKGDKILKVNNKKVATWDDFSIKMSTSDGKPVLITYLRNNEYKSTTITPSFDKKENRYIIGVSPIVIQNPTFLQSLYSGFQQTIFYLKQTFMFWGTLFTGHVSMNDFGGPISILKVSVAAAKAGIITLTFLSAYISIQLAIFNILPFPALDGGYIFLFLFEIISGKKVSDDKIGIINSIGFALLLTLMVLVAIKDILYPIKF